MNRKICILLIILSILSISFSESVGATVKDIDIEMVINSDLSVTETMFIQSFNRFSTNASYMYVFFNEVPVDLVITDSLGNNVNFTYFVANDIFTVRLDCEISPNDTQEFILKFNNEDIVKKFDNNYVFSYYLTSYYNLSDISIKLFLPVGFGITRKEGNTVSPPTSRLFSDGRQIIIEWVDDLNYLESNTYLVFFEALAFGGFSVLGSVFSGVIGFFIGSLLVYLFFKKNKKKIVTMALTKDEKQIIDFILNNDNEVFQNDIGKSLDFSKPKLSKLIHNLQSKNILISKHEGRKNKISVNKEII